MLNFRLKGQDFINIQPFSDKEAVFDIVEVCIIVGTSTIQHTATHYNTLQHTTTPYTHNEAIFDIVEVCIIVDKWY